MDARSQACAAYTTTPPRVRRGSIMENIERANRRLSTITPVDSEKRPSQLDQAMAHLAAIGKQNGTLAPDQAVGLAQLSTGPQRDPSPAGRVPADNASVSSQQSRAGGSSSRQAPSEQSSDGMRRSLRVLGSNAKDRFAATGPAAARRLRTCKVTLQGKLARSRAVAPATEANGRDTSPAASHESEGRRSLRSSSSDRSTTPSWAPPIRESVPAAWIASTEQERRNSLLPDGTRPPYRLLGALRRPSLGASDASFTSWAKSDDGHPDIIRFKKTGHWYVLHPMSPLRIVWDHLLIVLVVASVLAVPLQLAFCDEPTTANLTVIIAVLDLLLVLDLCSNFLFGFVVFNRATATVELVTKPDLIAKRYLRNWFAIELLSIGPISLLSDRPLWMQWLSLLKVLRLQRLLRVQARERQRANEAGRMQRRGMVATKMFGIVKLLALFLLYSHVCGCVYWFIGRIQERSTRAPPWSIDELEGDVCDLNSHHYITSLYWAITTALTVGFGDIVPTTTLERIFVCAMMLTSSVLYASIFGQVTTLVHSIDRIQTSYQMHLQQYNEFSQMYKLPTTLRCRIYSLVHYRWQLTRGFETEAVISTLPSGLRRDVQLFLLSSCMSNFPLFVGTPANFIAAVVEMFRADLVGSHEFVFTADEPGKHLYVIHTGIVEIITAEGVSVGKLARKQYFGEISILVDVRRTSSVRTLARCHFYKLSKEDFDGVLEAYPELKDRMVSKAMGRLKAIMKVRMAAGVSAPTTRRNTEVEEPKGDEEDGSGQILGSKLIEKVNHAFSSGSAPPMQERRCSFDRPPPEADSAADAAEADESRLCWDAQAREAARLRRASKADIHGSARRRSSASSVASSPV